MKKYCLLFIALIMLASCTPAYRTIEYTENNKTENTSSMFVVIEETQYWRIVYHRETKVMYSVQRGAESDGLLAPLYNRDGSLMVYKN